MKSLEYNKETGKIFRNGREAGYINYYGYRVISVNGKRYLAHHLVWFLEFNRFPINQLDHINHNRSDNRIDNLREVSNQENNQNCSRKITNKSGYTGISWDKVNNKWRSSIFYNGKSYNLGRYNLLEDAINARKLANIKFGFHENHGKETT